MGQQQLLLIILGVIIIGIAIAVGITMFSSASVQSNKDAIVNDLNNLAANAYQYKIRPTTMGGGQGSYANYTIPTKLQTNDNGSFAVVGAGTATKITLKGSSSSYSPSYVQADCDSNGRLNAFTYSGQF